MIVLGVGAIRLTGPSRDHLGRLVVLWRVKLSIGEEGKFSTDGRDWVDEEN